MRDELHHPDGDSEQGSSGGDAAKDCYNLNIKPDFAGAKFFEEKRQTPRSVMLWLGNSGTVERIPNPKRNGHSLYRISAFDKWDQGRLDVWPPRDFYTDPATGKVFLWMKKLDGEPYRSRYHTTRESIYRWEDPESGGCAPLGGSRPLVLRLRIKGKTHGGRTQRDYVEVDFLDRLATAGYVSQEIEEHDNWIDLAAVEDLGLDAKRAIADSVGDPRRRKIKPTPEPVLGRFIETKCIDRQEGRQWARVVLWWKPDVIAVVNKLPPDPKFWIDRKTIKAEYLLDNMTLWFYETRETPELGGKTLRTKIHAMGPEIRRRVKLKFWWKAQVTRLAAFLDGLSYKEREKIHATIAAIATADSIGLADHSEYLKQIPKIPEKTVELLRANGTPPAPQSPAGKGGRPRHRDADPELAKFKYETATQCGIEQGRGRKLRDIANGLQWPDGKLVGIKGLKSILRWVNRNPR